MTAVDQAVLEDRATAVRIALDMLAREGAAAVSRARLAELTGLPRATVDGWFPARADLLAAVVEELIRRRVALHAPKGSPREQLRAHLDVLNHALDGDATVFRAFGELAVAAVRDPAIAGLLSAADLGWYSWLVDLLDAGIADGSFRAGLDAGATAWAIMAMFRGLCLQHGLGRDCADVVVDQVERLLLPEGAA